MGQQEIIDLSTTNLHQVECARIIKQNKIFIDNKCGVQKKFQIPNVII